MRGALLDRPEVDQSQRSEPALRLLVELPSRRQVFLGNLRDIVYPRPVPPLELRSAPAPYWADVFVCRPLPWSGFLESGAGHVIAIALLIAGTRFFALQPHAVIKPAFDHAQVVYYQASEYLTRLDTRIPEAVHPTNADPEYSRQPVISVPREADNRSQTIVAPPNIRLKRDVALPNIVAWSESLQEPKLAIPAAPLTLAADLARLAPQVQNSVVTPPPDAAHLTHRRNLPALQASVVAPPPDLRFPSADAALNAPQPSIVQPSVIAPPPSVEVASARPPGDLNIGRSSVIAPAPQLPVAEQRAIVRGRSSPAVPAPQVVPPPPSVSAGPSCGSFGSRGRIIALNLHPSVGAPPVAPPGNRRGAFAATPEGHPAASRSPGSSFAGANGSGKGTERGKKGTSDIPAGLYVGAAPAAGPGAKTTPLAGASPTSAASNAVNPNLIASVRAPHVAGPTARILQPSTANLSEAEREVFGNRRFYSLTLNMPNLNSAGGSWVIRFAELKQDPNSAAADLSQPMATRKVDPAYPMQLMRENIAGTVIVYAVIHADGSVGSVRVLRGVDDRLDRYASQAVAQWQFHPATKNGTPIDVEATFQIPFRPSRQNPEF